MKLPDDTRLLPNLDLEVKINEHGKVKHKLHVKTANRGITLHFKSRHPTSVKRNTVLNKFRCAEQASTDEHRAEALSVTKNKATQQWLPKRLAKAHKAHPTVQSRTIQKKSPIQTKNAICN